MMMTLLSTNTTTSTRSSNSLLLLLLILALSSKEVVHAQVIYEENTVPEGMTCDGGGAGTIVTFQGTCANQTHTFTPQCKFEDTTFPNTDDPGCTVTYEECGCVYWEQTATQIAGKLYNPKEGCDPCPFSDAPTAAPGTSGASATCRATTTSGFVVVLGSFAALFMGVLFI